MDDWKTPTESRGVQSAKRLVFAHAKLLDAKGEHRGKAGFEVEATLFDLSQVGDELGGNLALFTDQSADIRQEIVIRNVREIHGNFDVAREISHPGAPLWRAISRRLDATGVHARASARARRESARNDT
jgi:hypothetical protein